MNLTKEQIEKKTLSGECWIKVSDFELRIDYPTRNQDAEYRRLKSYWDLGMGGESEHFMNYYIRSTVKAVRGLTIEGQDVELESIGGLAMNLKSNSVSVDLIEVLLGLGKWEDALVSIRERLSVTNLDKKKLNSQPDLSKTESSKSQQDSPEPTSLTPIIQFEKTGETISSTAKT